MRTQELGVIKSIRVGMVCGRDNNLFGASVGLGADGWGVSAEIKGPDFQDKMAALLRDAKVEDTAQLVGKPITVEFSNGWLATWGILKACVP